MFAGGEIMSSEKDVYDRLSVRNDVWAKQSITPDEKGRYGYFTQKSELTREVIDRSLLTKTCTIGLYTVNPKDNMCVNPTIDIDNHSGNLDIIPDVVKIYTALKDAGMYPYIEASAGELKDGAHIGVICKRTPATIAKRAVQTALDSTGLKHEVNPKQDQIEEGKYGNLVKAPFQYHNRTKARSQIINPETMQPFSRQDAINYMMALPDTVFEAKEGIETPIQTIKEATTATTEPIKSVIKTGMAFDELFDLRHIKPCVKKCFNERWALHGGGDEGHNFRVGAAGDLIYNGATDEQVKTYFSVQPEYSEKTTGYQVKKTVEYIKAGNKPTGCKRLKEQCPDLLNGMCTTCKNKPKETITDIPIPEIAGSLQFENNYELVEKAQARQPVYFDVSGNYSMWDKKNLCWVMIDKTDLFKSIVDITARGSYVVRTAVKNEIAEAMRITGRAREIKPIDASWVYCKNGVYDSKEKKIFPPSMEYFFTQPIPHNIGKTEETPIIDKIFIDWMGSNAKVLYEICAYCLIDAYPIHRMFWLYGGRGRNGKDQFLELLQRLVGEKNTIATDLEMLSSSRFESSKLYKKKLAIISEVETQILKNTGRVKALTGHSLLRGEFKGRDGFDFYNTAKIIIASNSVPETTDKSRAYFARCVMLEFKGDFAGRQFNKSIIDTIPEYEYENLLRKCFNKILPELLECGEFHNEGTTEEKEANYERMSNPYVTFKERELEEKQNNQIPVWVLREIYNLFAEKNNYRQVSEREFTQSLIKDGIELRRGVINGHKWNIAYGLTTKRGYKLKDDGKLEISEKEESGVEGEKKKEDSKEIRMDKKVYPVHPVQVTSSGDDLDYLDGQFSLGIPAYSPNGSIPSKPSKPSIDPKKPVMELNNTCGICGKDLDSGENEFIGKGLGSIHTKCKYESRRVRAKVNTQYVNMNHTPAQMVAGEVYDLPAIQAMDFIRSGLVVVCDEVAA